MPLSYRVRIPLHIGLSGLIWACAPQAWAEDAPSTRPAGASSEAPTPILSRDVEVQYRLDAGDPDARIELWYTRDRGATWQCAGTDTDGESPYQFSAPAEGMYGLRLQVRRGDAPPKGPDRFQTPQRWVLIDATAPLLQWDGVDRDEAFAKTRTLHLRWTAFDDHFASRPIALDFQTQASKDWQTVDRELPNLGRFDWRVPTDVKGAVSLRLTAKDQAGNSTERVYGPVELDPKPAPVTTRPAVAVTTRPAEVIPPTVTLEARQRAEQLYQMGSAHLNRGEYAVAAERFREALETDPSHLPARNDLAGIFYLQRDYGKAVEFYNEVLHRDAKYGAALRGVALAYVAQKQYADSRAALQRLLMVDPKDAEAWLDLGDVLFMMGSTPDARMHWDKAASVNPLAEAIIQKAKRRLETYTAGGTAGSTPGATTP